MASAMENNGGAEGRVLLDETPGLEAVSIEVPPDDLPRSDWKWMIFRGLLPLEMQEAVLADLHEPMEEARSTAATYGFFFFFFFFFGVSNNPTDSYRFWLSGAWTWRRKHFVCTWQTQVGAHLCWRPFALFLFMVICDLVRATGRPISNTHPLMETIARAAFAAACDLAPEVCSYCE